MEKVVDKLYFQPVNPHQYFPLKVIAEDEQDAGGFEGVLRLAYYYKDQLGQLSLMVVFRRPGEYHADRVLAYQAVIGPSDRINDPAAAVPSIADAAAACEKYWHNSLAKVFGG